MPRTPLGVRLPAPAIPAVPRPTAPTRHGSIVTDQGQLAAAIVRPDSARQKGQRSFRLAQLVAGLSPALQQIGQCRFFGHGATAQSAAPWRSRSKSASDGTGRWTAAFLEPAPAQRLWSRASAKLESSPAAWRACAAVITASQGQEAAPTKRFVAGRYEPYESCEEIAWRSPAGHEVL